MNTRALSVCACCYCLLRVSDWLWNGEAVTVTHSICHRCKEEMRRSVQTSPPLHQLSPRV